MRANRIASTFLALLLLFAVGFSAAEQQDLGQTQLPVQRDQIAEDQILERAETIEEDCGKLRTVSIHVYSNEEPRIPAEGEAADTAFLKDLSNGLENRWKLEGKETPDMTTRETVTLYADFTAAELEYLEKYRDARMDDPLQDFLCHAYITWLDRQSEVLLNPANETDAIWRWNEARKEGIKTLFFLNRYYGVYVHPSFKSKMSSFLYEGAMTVRENTIEEMIVKLAAAPDATSGNTAAGVTGEKAGSDKWHAEPTNTYEFRVFDFDTEKLILHAELRNSETGKTIPCGEIDFSIWDKYRKDRQTVDTFYKVGEIQNTEGKLSFNFYANVRFDGRLYQEVKAKITLKLPEKAGTDSTAAAVGTESPIEQDFTDLMVGSHLFMGYYEQDGNVENQREPIEWVVLSINKRKNVGLIVSVKGLEVLSYGWPGKEEAETAPGFNWKTSYVRAWLSEEFYENSFSDAEKARIRLATNVTKDPSGRFTTKDYAFLLSAEEAKRYMHTPKGMICEPTEYAKSKLGPDGIVEEKYCIWYVRELTRATIVYRDGTLKRNTWNEVGYVSGSMGMHHYSRIKGLKVYDDKIATVRPAMWVKFGDMK